MAKRRRSSHRTFTDNYTFVKQCGYNPRTGSTMAVIRERFSPRGKASYLVTRINKHGGWVDDDWHDTLRSALKKLDRRCRNGR